LKLRKKPRLVPGLVGGGLLPVKWSAYNLADYIFFFFFIFFSVGAMASLVVPAAGAVASLPDLAAAPPLVPPPVWAKAAPEKAKAAATTGIKIFRIYVSIFPAQISSSCGAGFPVH
jgi:hypothetical protein